MRVMGFARTVIYDWLNKYRAGGIEALRALPIPGRPPKLTEQQRAWVYRTVTQNNPLQLQFEFALWTRAMVRDLIRQNCGVTLSLASVGRLLRSLGLTPQRPVRRAIEQVPAKVREWLTVDYPAIQAKARKAGAQIFFADEAGVRSNSHHSGTTWAPMGQTPVVPATGKRFGLNLVSAVSPQGVLRRPLHPRRAKSGSHTEGQPLRSALLRATRPLPHRVPPGRSPFTVAPVNRTPAGLPEPGVGRIRRLQPSDLHRKSHYHPSAHRAVRSRHSVVSSRTPVSVGVPEPPRSRR